VCFAKFDLRGTRIGALAQPYRYDRLKRARDEYAAMSADERNSLDGILDPCNMAPLVDATLAREIGRKNDREARL
jgi:hypothetical protein